MSTNVHISIGGMKCSGCAKSVKNALNELNGIKSVEISVEKGFADIELTEDNSLTPEEIVETIKDAGYDAVPS